MVVHIQGERKVSERTMNLIGAVPLKAEYGEKANMSFSSSVNVI
jgi:hypothetical protein